MTEMITDLLQKPLRDAAPGAGVSQRTACEPERRLRMPSSRKRSLTMVESALGESGLMGAFDVEKTSAMIRTASLFAGSAKSTPPHRAATDTPDFVAAWVGITGNAILTPVG